MIIHFLVDLPHDQRYKERHHVGNGESEGIPQIQVSVRIEDQVIDDTIYHPACDLKDPKEGEC